MTTDPDFPRTADEALARLKEGNERFVAGRARFPTVQKEVLAELAKGQEPYAQFAKANCAGIQFHRVSVRSLQRAETLTVIGATFYRHRKPSPNEALRRFRIDYACERLRTRSKRQGAWQ